MPVNAAKPYRKVGGGLVMTVRLTPKSARNEIGNIDLYGDLPVLKARVRAVPEKGKANSALEKLIARWLGVPRSSVSVTAGATARLKSLTITGDPAALAAAVEARTGTDGKKSGQPESRELLPAPSTMVRVEVLAAWRIAAAF